jgi:hypothetical protein
MDPALCNSIDTLESASAGSMFRHTIDDASMTGNVLDDQYIEDFLTREEDQFLLDVSRSTENPRFSWGLDGVNNDTFAPLL